MIQLSSDGASIIFDFINSQHYLYGTGTITVPLNTLTLVLDESDMVTFKKSEGDIFVSAPIEEFEGFDKESIASWFASNGVGTPVADGIQFKVVNALPTVGSPKFLYLVQSEDGWAEWAYQNGQWIQFGVMQTVGYNGKDAIEIAKSATTASAYTVSLKIDADDKFLHQTSGGVRDYANLRTSADTEGHQHIVLSGYGAGEVSNIKIDDYTGLSAISANNIDNQISLIIDPASNTAITQSNAGLKLTVEPDVKINSASTRPPETKEVFKRFDELEIKSAQTVSSTTYQLYSLDEPKDVKIEVVNDKYTSAITVDNDNQQILLDVVQPDKTVKVLSGDASQIIFEEDAKDGLRIDNHLLKVKIDDASNTGLTVSATGVKLTAENNVKTASASTRPVETAEVYKRFNELEIKSGETVSSTTYQLYSLDEAKPVKVEVPNDKYTSAVTIDNANQQILLDVVQPDKTVKVLSGNMEEVIFEDDAKDGLEINNHLLKVKIDPASNTGLTVSLDGVKSTVETDVKTASASTRPLETKEIYKRFSEIEIQSGETVSSTTYDLYTLDEKRDVQIEVPNDQYVSAITVDNDAQQIVLDLKKADGTVQKLSGDATEVIFEDDAKDGLEIDNHLLKVKIDPASNSGLTVSLDGVKSTVETDVKINSASTRPLETKEIYKRFNELKIESSRTDNADVYNLYSLDEKKDKDIEVKDTFHIVSALPTSGDAEILYILEETNPTTSAKTYTQHIYKDNAWVQTSALGNVYSAGTNIDIYKAQPTDDFYTISGSQVVDLTQAEYDALATKDPDKIYNITDAEPYILSAYTNIEIASALTQDNQTVHRVSAKNYEVVSALPAVADAMENTIYLLKVGTAPDVWYDEYAKIDGAWEKLSVDLSDFVLNAGEY